MKFWSTAKSLAAKTPDDRNRYVDFLRAISILMVITGHWLVAAPWLDGDTFVAGDLLELRVKILPLVSVSEIMPLDS